MRQFLEEVAGPGVRMQKYTKHMIYPQRVSHLLLRPCMLIILTGTKAQAWNSVVCEHTYTLVGTVHYHLYPVLKIHDSDRLIIRLYFPHQYRSTSKLDSPVFPELICTRKLPCIYVVIDVSLLLSLAASCSHIPSFLPSSRLTLIL